ncbi:MAG TPA: hypothetical protein VFZ53_17805 [Polyangiaceae bacterium]
MFWVALATAIMMLSGEGDDVRAIAMLIAGLRQSIYVHVEDETRRARALDAVGRFESEFVRHRKELERFGHCVESADRKYGATRADYATCEARAESERARLAQALRDVHSAYEAAVEPDERANIARDIAALPDAWVLDPTLVRTDEAPRTQRFRGLEGTAASRHLTLPRNVVGVVFGPLGPATFGQRFPSRTVDAGTSYAHEDFHGSSASLEAPNTIATRLGCRFGLFDDIEGGAVFLPFELSPEFAFEPVLAYVTDQFRFEDVDVAFRFSLQTPGDFGWSVAPGGLLGLPGRRVALQAGAFVPMELGSFKEQQPARTGFVAPLRVTLNIVPALFVSAESAFAYDDFDVPDTVSVPLGFGAGYSFLAGSRLVEFTGSFTWDHFLLPARPGGLEAFQPEVFRAAFGASMYFQAL